MGTSAAPNRSLDPPSELPRLQAARDAAAAGSINAFKLGYQRVNSSAYLSNNLVPTLDELSRCLTDQFYLTI